MSSTPSETTVTILLERLRQLEEYEAAVLADKEKTKQRFAVLQAKHKPDPAEHAKRVLERYHANREEILARRRELRKAKKAAAAATSAVGTTTS